MRKRLSKIVLTILIAFACQAIAESVWIDDVNIVPEQPLATDVITFNIFGGASSKGSWVEYDQFSQDETSLQLDLHIDLGMLPTTSYWSYSKQIGSLEPGTYLLTVRAFAPNRNPWNGALQDTYITEFTVTPEPATFVFLAIGLPVFRVFSRKKT